MANKDKSIDFQKYYQVVEWSGHYKNAHQVELLSMIDYCHHYDLLHRDFVVNCVRYCLVFLSRAETQHNVMANERCDNYLKTHQQYISKLDIVKINSIKN